MHTPGCLPLGLFRSWMRAHKETADRICAHEVDILGSGLQHLGENINWQVPWPEADCDVKNAWELSRFQFLPTLARAYEVFNDEKYAREARELIHDWILKNPFGKGINWACTMDTAIRACNFSLAWFFLEQSPSWHEKKWREIFLTSILEHGKFIFRTLEYGPGYNTNHFLADTVGLLFLGTLFPQFREAWQWRTTALDALETEMQRQVYADGVSFEASIPYHRLAAELFGHAALLCKENNLKLSKKFWQRLEKMFEFTWNYTKPNGLAPQIGDNDDGRLFIFDDFYSWERRDHRHLFRLAQALFPLNKKFTQSRVRDEAAVMALSESAEFKEGGIYIMRKNDFYCIVDCGGNGLGGHGGHAHNDTLSFELAIDGEDFIIDPGTYVYSGNPQARFHFRSTRMHNTVMIDGQEMNRFKKYELFRMRNDAVPNVTEWQSDETHDVLKAYHTGYKRLRPSVIHHREFTFNKEKYVLEINDLFDGKGTHTLEWNFHFADGIECEMHEGGLIAKKNDKKMEMIFPRILSKHASVREDFVSPRYGVKEKAQVFTISLPSYDISTHQPFTFILKAL